MKKIIISTLTCLFFATALQASPLDDLIKSGNTFWSQGKLTEAKSEFQKAIDLNPDSSVAHERMANLLLTQNKSVEASKEYQNAIVNDPENAKLFIGLAITYLHQKYYQMAEAMVNQAIEIDPELANAKKLKTYIDAKKERIAQKESGTTDVSMSNGGGMHGQVPTATTAASPHGQASPHGEVAPSMHGSTNSAIPASVQKNIQKTH